MPCVVPFLWRVAPRSELADLLPPAASCAKSICNRNHFDGAVSVARTPFASAPGIRKDARLAQRQAMEARSVISFLCCLFACGGPSDSTSPARPPIQLSVALYFAGRGF